MKYIIEVNLIEKTESTVEDYEDILKTAYDRGYFDEHPDDSEMEKDEKFFARKIASKL